MEDLASPDVDYTLLPPFPTRYLICRIVTKFLTIRRRDFGPIAFCSSNKCTADFGVEVFCPSAVVAYNAP